MCTRAKRILGAKSHSHRNRGTCGDADDRNRFTSRYEAVRSDAESDADRDEREIERGAEPRSVVGYDTASNNNRSVDAENQDATGEHRDAGARGPRKIRPTVVDE